MNLPSTPQSASVLPDGRLLVLLDPSAQANSPAAMVVDFSQLSATPVDLGLGPQEARWLQVVVNNSGRGLLVSDTTGSAVRIIDTDPAVESLPTANAYRTDAKFVIGHAGQKAVQWRPIATGIAISQWDVVTGSPITVNEVGLTGVADVLDFDDASGMLLVRHTNGKVALFDIHDSVTLKQEFTGIDAGPATLDPLRSFAVIVDQGSGQLVIYDWLLETVTARYPAPVVGVQGLKLASEGDVAMLITATAVQALRLDRPIAARVSLATESMSGQASFGVKIKGDNDRANVNKNIARELEEDTTLQIADLAAAAGVDDAQQDGLAYLLITQPQHGAAIIDPHGSLVYRPSTDYFGTDQLTFVVHDGRQASETVTLDLNITPVDDPVAGVQINLLPGFNPLPQNTPAGTPIGQIVINSPDPLSMFNFNVNHPWFNIQQNWLIIAGGAQIQGQEPIEIEINVNRIGNPNDGATASISIPILDTPEPPTGIDITSAEVPEASVGVSVATLSVIDPDSLNTYIFSVLGDDRFVISGNVLSLAPNASLDYETESTVVVTVRVEDVDANATLDSELTVTVTPINEAPTDLQLQANGILERSFGARVGNLTTTDPDAGDEHTYSVDDDRFEISGGNLLKLRDDAYVLYSVEQVVVLHVTTTDRGSLSYTREVRIPVIQNERPYHNGIRPHDVDNNNLIEPRDALIIINILNNNGPHALIEPRPEGGGLIDVNGDGMITPIDALLIINALNHSIRSEPNSGINYRLPNGQGTGVGNNNSPTDPQNPKIASGEPDQGPLNPTAPVAGPVVGPILPPPAPSGSNEDRRDDDDEDADLYDILAGARR